MRWHRGVRVKLKLLCSAVPHGIEVGSCCLMLAAFESGGLIELA